MGTKAKNQKPLTFDSLNSVRSENLRSIDSRIEMTVAKTVHYRKFDQGAGGFASDLEALLKNALATNTLSGLTIGQDPKSREFDVPRDVGLKRISLYITEETDYIFGTILLYSPN